MNIVSVSGLVLDLSGVLLLGYDLVRVQRSLRAGAENRVAHLDEILDEIGGIDAWAKTVPSDFREWDWEEGRAVMRSGTFDADQAGKSFEEALETISQIGVHVLILARMQLAAVEEDRSTAGLSVKYTYIGLALVVAGFCLQLPAYLN
jgi:hypothetical protein